MVRICTGSVTYSLSLTSTLTTWSKQWSVISCIAKRMSCTDCTITRLTTRMICTATQTQQWRPLIVILRIYALTTYLLRKLRRALMPEVIRFREVGER